MSDRTSNAFQQNQVNPQLFEGEVQQAKDSGKGPGEDRNANNGAVTGGDVTDAKKGATMAAQATVDNHFPKPILEERTWLERDADLNMGVFDPENVYPFTDSFKRLAPAERFNKDGWTADLKKDMVDIVVDHIKETGKRGELGKDSSHRQDVRSALKMAGQADDLDGFVGEVNKKLDADPAFAKLDVAVKHYPEQNPWVGSHRDASTYVTVEGGSGNRRQQRTGFDDKFDPHHTKKFSDMNLAGKFEKDGWTPEVAKQVVENVIANIEGSGKDARFGATDTEFRDVRSCLRIARNAGKLEETIAVVNKLQAAKYAPQLVQDDKKNSIGFMNVAIKGSMTPASKIHMRDKYYIKPE